MSDAKPPSQPTPAGAGTGAATSTSNVVPPKPPRPQNPALRMMGMPALPRKLPSRNWMIFWGITAAFTTAIIYDKREKKRATAKWRRAVAPLATETISSPHQLPRKLTIYLEAPPGDTLRVAQDHFIEYVKPVLSESGLDWEFVQGRMQGDVRAAVAEKIRRARRAQERPAEELPETDESSLMELRKRMGVPEYEGLKGDLVIGLHTWKEYVRGLHEGWLGPLDPPQQPTIEAHPTVEAPPADTQPAADGEGEPKPEAKAEEKEEKKKEEQQQKKPERPPQPPPYNTPNDYASAALPASIPAEFSPSVAIPFPFRLGFTNTFVRLGWFLNRRKLADNIGRDVAAVCFGASRDWRSTEDGEYEQQLVLKEEEKNWVKSVWKDDPPAEGEDGDDKPATTTPPKEKIWISPVVLDRRVAERMRRFEMTPENEARAAEVVVPEEEIEGWMKGSLRSLWRWGASSFEKKHRGPNVGNLDD